MEVKVQCSCGYKFAFDVEPVNGQMPATIFCPQCQADVTPLANAIIQQQLSAPSPVSTSSPSASEPSKPKLRVGGSSHATPAAAPQPATVAAAAAASTFGFCNRHVRTPAAARCVVCQKPICRECMSQFGYLCSVNCRYQAEQKQITVPFYEGHRSVMEANSWRKAGLLSALVVLIIASLFGTWFWYIWSGSKPHTFYTLPFAKDDAPLHGQFISKNEILLVRSKKLTLHDIKKKADVWTADLDVKLPAEDETAPPKNAALEAADEMFGSEGTPKIHLTRDSIWVCLGHKLLSFDLKTGASKQAIRLPGRAIQFAPNENWISAVSLLRSGKKAVTRVDLSNSEVVSEEFKVTPVEKQFITDEMPQGASPTAAYLLNYELSTDAERTKVLKKVFSQFVPAGISAVEMQVRLTQPNLVAVAAMKKAGPSIINENTSASTSTASALEEISNDIKRSRTGGMKYVDESSYKVTIRRLMGSAGEPWTADVVGPPAFFPQKTVDLLVAGKTLYILDKQNNRLAESKLTYGVGEYFEHMSGTAGPARELDNTLYFFDQGVLTAFDLPSCNVRWRITTVGISEIKTDGHGNLYVNTTTAAPEDIQYSEQIKVTDRTEDVLLKVEMKTGKILWKSKGAVSARLTGSFLYASSEPTGGLGILVGLQEAFDSKVEQRAPIFRIYRLSPSSGKRIWELDQSNAPDEVDFNENRILLLNSKEMQVMKYLAF